MEKIIRINGVGGDDMFRSERTMGKLNQLDASGMTSKLT